MKRAPNIAAATVPGNEPSYDELLRYAHDCPRSAMPIPTPMSHRSQPMRLSGRSVAMNAPVTAQVATITEYTGMAQASSVVVGSVSARTRIPAGQPTADTHTMPIAAGCSRARGDSVV